VWFDWWIENAVFKPYLKRFAAYLYNRGWEWGLGTAINYKNDAYPPGTAVWDIERGGLSKLHPFRTAWGFLRFLLYLRCKLKLARAGIIVEP
jgi:hypothetical protein